MHNLESKSKNISFSTRKTILYSLLPLLLLFGGIEGCARLLELWRPPLTLDYGWGFNEDSRVFMPAGFARNTMITRPEKQASFVLQSFQMPKPTNVYRIFILGGSNVNYMHLPLMVVSNRLSNTPGETRSFEIINMGGLAYGSHRLRIMIPEILGYEPDLILLYAGHNEFEEVEHQALVNLDRLSIQKAAYSLASLRTIRDLWVSIELVRRTTSVLQEKQQPEVHWTSSSTYEFSEEEIATRMDLYRDNLNFIVSTFLEKNTPVIISTVATNLWKPGLSQAFSKEAEEIERLYMAGNYEEGMQRARDVLVRSTRHQASDVENNIIRDIAKKYDLPLIEGEHLIMDAESNGVPGETLLSDNCHLTLRGMEIVLSEFEKEIRQIARAGKQVNQEQ